MPGGEILQPYGQLTTPPHTLFRPTLESVMSHLEGLSSKKNVIAFPEFKTEKKERQMRISGVSLILQFFFSIITFRAAFVV
jgi:hypothetical protein